MRAAGIMSNTAAGSRWPSHPQEWKAAAAAPRSKGSARHGWGARALPVLAPRQVQDAWQLVGRGGAQARSPRSAGSSSPWSPPAGWGRRGELPRNVFWEAMLLASPVGVKGMVQQIRHRLWLLATTGKDGRKAIGSAHYVADLADLAVVLPAGCPGEQTHAALARRGVNRHFICLLVFFCFQREPPFPLSPQDFSTGRKHICRAVWCAMKGLTETYVSAIAVIWDGSTACPMGKGRALGGAA